jgi:hypothetical protein
MEAPGGQVRSRLPVEVCESGYLEKANELIHAGLGLMWNRCQIPNGSAAGQILGAIA